MLVYQRVPTGKSSKKMMLFPYGFPIDSGRIFFRPPGWNPADCLACHAQDAMRLWPGGTGLESWHQKAIENAWKMMENGDLMGFQW